MLLTASSPRRVRLNSSDARDDVGHSPQRGRLNSREIPRTYSGLYGNQDDLLPFELNRQTTTPQSHLFMGVTYISLLAMLQVFAILLSYSHSWTITNTVHGFFSIVYIHWIKGSLSDVQGEMEHLTIWEQLEGTKNTKSVREFFFIVPTVLAYVACHVSGYDYVTCAINIAVWCVCMIAKLPFMNGVRIFGINSTAGIDDEDDQRKKR